MDDTKNEKRIGRGRGRGRGLQKDWLNTFKPKPAPITVERILASENQFSDSEEKVDKITTKLNQQTLNENNNNVMVDEKPSNMENSKNTNSVLLKAVNAKEFIPTAASFRPISAQIPLDEAPPASDILDGVTEDEYAQSVLMNAVLTLTVAPEEFDNQIKWVAEELKKHVKTEDSLNEVIRIILDQAIAENTFSYGAAKMCHYFDEQKVFDEVNSFRKIFFKMCQDLFQLVKETLSSPTATTSGSTVAIDFKKLSNIAIFFGELFCNMKIKHRPNVVFKKALLMTIPLFLESKEEILVRCLTRLLKLIGPEMDKHDAEKKEVDEMFNKVREFSFGEKCGYLPENVKDGMRKVYRLRTRNWDINSPPSSPLESPRAIQKFHMPSVQRKESSSTIGSHVDWDDYYAGDDGDIYANYMGGYTDEHPPYEAMGIPQDDEEDAYEQFLMESGQI